MKFYLDNNILIGLAQGHYCEFRNIVEEFGAVVAFSFATIADTRHSQSNGQQISEVLDSFPYITIEQQRNGVQFYPRKLSAREYFDIAAGKLEPYADLLAAQEKILLHSIDGKIVQNGETVREELGRALRKIEPNRINAENERLNRNYLNAFEIVNAKKEEQTRLKAFFFPPNVHVNAFRPPNIIQQISNQFSESTRSKFLSLFFIEPENSFLTLYSGAQALGYLGFGESKKLKGSIQDKALRAAASELRDFEHIAYGLHCDIFVTADKATAKRAFALKEYHGLSCEVVFADRDRIMSVVDADSWF